MLVDGVTGDLNNFHNIANNTNPETSTRERITYTAEQLLTIRNSPLAQEIPDGMVFPEAIRNNTLYVEDYDTRDGA